MDAILTLVITVGLRVLEYFLLKNKADTEMLKKFYEFAEKMSGEYLNSVKLKDSYQKQLEKLKGIKNANP